MLEWWWCHRCSRNQTTCTVHHDLVGFLPFFHSQELANTVLAISLRVEFDNALVVVRSSPIIVPAYASARPNTLHQSMV